MFGYATLILVGFFVCIYGSIRSILLLIEFGNEDRSVIEEEAENRKKVASTVSEIVHKMDTDFRDTPSRACGRAASGCRTGSTSRHA